jgi:hypothetical protein
MAVALLFSFKKNSNLMLNQKPVVACETLTIVLGTGNTYTLPLSRTLMEKTIVGIAVMDNQGGYVKSPDNASLSQVRNNELYGAYLKLQTSDNRADITNLPLKVVSEQTTQWGAFGVCLADIDTSKSMVMFSSGATIPANSCLVITFYYEA